VFWGNSRVVSTDAAGRVVVVGDGRGSAGLRGRAARSPLPVVARDAEQVVYCRVKETREEKIETYVRK